MDNTNIPNFKLYVKNDLNLQASDNFDNIFLSEIFENELSTISYKNITNNIIATKQLYYWDGERWR